MPLIKAFLSFIIKFIGMVYTYKLHVIITSIKNYCFSCWIKSQIGTLGPGSMIYRGCTLDGGGAKNIYIGKGTTIQKNAVLGVWQRYGNQCFSPELVIGDNCSLGENIHISTINKVVIGDGLLTGRYVYISDNNHGGLSSRDNHINPSSRELTSKGGIIIGNNVWIGDKVSILSGVTIGDGCIIAAHSVVTQSVPPKCMVAGVPARIIKTLSENNDEG